MGQFELQPVRITTGSNYNRTAPVVLLPARLNPQDAWLADMALTIPAVARALEGPMDAGEAGESTW